MPFSCPFIWENIHPVIPILFAYLFVLSLISMIKASWTDPGVSSKPEKRYVTIKFSSIDLFICFSRSSHVISTFSLPWKHTTISHLHLVPLGIIKSHLCPNMFSSETTRGRCATARLAASIDHLAPVIAVNAITVLVSPNHYV